MGEVLTVKAGTAQLKVYEPRVYAADGVLVGELMLT